MSDTQLTQTEIDALMSAVTTGQVDTGPKGADTPSTQASAVKHDTSWISHDIGTQEKFLRSRLVALDGIHERFSRLFRMTLSNTLKRMVSVTYTHTEFVHFAEYMNSVPFPTSLNIISIFNPGGCMIFIVGSKLTYAMVEAYYGGGTGAKSEMSGKQEFTQIERSMIQKISHLAVRDMEEAWKLNYPVVLRYQRTESNPLFVGGIIHGSETVAVVNFEVEFDKYSGQFLVLLQTRALDAIAQHLSVDITPELAMGQGAWYDHWITELMNLNVDLDVCLGMTQKTVADIVQLKTGDLLRLDQNVASPLSVSVQGIQKFKGMMGTFRGSAAVRLVTEMSDQLT